MPFRKSVFILKNLKGQPIGILKLTSAGGDAEIALEYRGAVRGMRVVVGGQQAFREFTLDGGHASSFRMSGRSAPDCVSVLIFSDGAVCGVGGDASKAEDLKVLYLREAARLRALEKEETSAAPSKAAGASVVGVKRRDESAPSAVPFFNIDVKNAEGLKPEFFETAEAEKKNEKEALREKIAEEFGEDILEKIAPELENPIDDDMESLERKIQEAIKRRQEINASDEKNSGQEQPEPGNPPKEAPAGPLESVGASDFEPEKAADAEPVLEHSELVPPVGEAVPVWSGRISGDEDKKKSEAAGGKDKDRGQFAGAGRFFEEAFEAAEFYKKVKPRLDEMLSIYPEEETLNAMIPNGRFVRIRYDGENFYVVGVYYRDGEAEYICYGIPGVYDVEPAGRLKRISRWFPADMSDKRGSGYWLIFQNASDGRVIEPPRA